jgi:predicted SprT family Zn-dependent metalloprotease
MDLILKAYCEIFPNREYTYKSVLKYSRRFNDYNANANRRGNVITVKMSYLWKDVDSDIQIGLIQDLLTRLLGAKKIDTSKMELYRLFIRKLGKNIPVEEVDPYLEISFHRVNEKYFHNTMDMPNLRFGNNTTHVAGTYNYHTDTITLSGYLKDADDDIIDLVIFHELLHKKMQYNHKIRRSIHHTKEFKQMERSFDKYKDIEKKLNNHIAWRRRYG